MDTNTDPIAQISQREGLWTITVDHGNLHYSRHAWTRERAEEIAVDLVQLARWMTKDRAE